MHGVRRLRDELPGERDNGKRRDRLRRRDYYELDYRQRTDVRLRRRRRNMLRIIWKRTVE
jgi:hypothetical protein